MNIEPWLVSPEAHSTEAIARAKDDAAAVLRGRYGNLVAIEFVELEDLGGGLRGYAFAHPAVSK